MRVVGVIGNYGKSNLGDEAIGDAIVDAVARSWGACRVVLCTPGRYLPVAVRVVDVVPGVDECHRTEHPADHAASGIGFGRQMDIVLIGGGGLLMDLHAWAIPKYVVAALLARFRRVPVALIGISVGPVRTIRGRAGLWLMRWLAKGALLRDGESKQALGSVHGGSVLVSDDAVFCQRGEPTPAMGVVGFSLLPWGDARLLYSSDGPSLDEYRQACVELGSFLVSDSRVRQLDLYCFDWRRDKEIAEHVKAAIYSQHPRAKVVVHCYRDWRVLWQRIAVAELVIATRLHSFIFSAAQGVPVVPVIYHEKVAGVVSALGWSGFAVPLARGWQEVVEERVRQAARLCNAGVALGRDERDSFVASTRMAYHSFLSAMLSKQAE